MLHEGIFFFQIDMSIDRFLLWFKSTDVNTDLVQVRYTNHSGFGLYSRQPIVETNSLILSIHESLFIKPSFQNQDFNGFEHLIEYLLTTLTDPYVEFLRTLRCIPSWCQFSTDNSPRQLLHSMNKHLNKNRHSREKFPQFTDEDFQWAYYVINTRCVHFNMEIDSKDQDDNLCLIPYLDFVNHSIQPNTISKFNPLTRSYEISSIKPIEIDEQITFLYNPHSNVDLFIEYGFVLSFNPSNLINIEYELEQILTKEQNEIIRSFNYWNSLEFYSGDHDLSWTVIKAMEIHLDQSNWSPYDDPSTDKHSALFDQFQFLLNMVRSNIEKDFQQWNTEHFLQEKTILFQDFQTIIDDTSISIKKSFGKS